jgi:phytol kinase
LVLLLCASFAVILLLSLKYNLLKSINAIDRESAGSIVYPVSVYGCYLAFDFFNQQYIYYYLPILIVAVCDPIAALAGKKWPAGKYKAGKENKTLIGSAMFFITSLVITWAMLKLEGEKTATIFFYGLFIAFVSTISEALSRKGYDNITIPVSVLLALVVMEKIF